MSNRPKHKAISPIALTVFGLVWLLSGSSYAGENLFWVFFVDKGNSSKESLGSAESLISPRAVERRFKTTGSRSIESADLPVSTEYVDRIARSPGVKIRRTSRWLNAISIAASSEGLEDIRRLPIVREVRPLAKRIGDPTGIHDPEQDDEILPPGRDHDLDYGNSLRQNSFMNIPEIHDMGYFGSGVLIGLCDAGFDNLDHRCFGNLIVTAAWDFVNDDANVADEGDAGSGRHGTRTLSIIAGFDEGHLIGVAHEAKYILAKTENTDWEEPVEEDAWVAAVEWMDSLGVDIISSSLGYINWYRYRDLDGETAVTTIIANRAVEVGIVIVNAMGNSGLNDFPGDKMITPADAFDVFSIGATNRDSTLAGFSSHGPTYDGRIKPDFVTFGSSVIMASSSNDTGYAGGGGTSYSAPAVAGLCALLLEADPYLTPLTLRELLRNVSDNRNEPDTLFGWGIPDGLEAFRQIAPERIDLHIPLHEGWNTVSINFRNLPARLFPDMLSTLVDAGHLILAKDGHGRFYSPGVPFNNIPFWNLNEGYQLNLSADDTLRFEGDLANYTKEMELSEGWQIIAYKPNFNLPTRDAMSSLTESGVLVILKDEWGRFYYPHFDFNNMPLLTPGRGYHIKLSQNASLRYPRKRMIDSNGETPLEMAHFQLPGQRTWGMSVLLLGGSGIYNGDEAAFIEENGAVIGAGVFRNNTCGIAVWGGEELREFPKLKIWNHTMGVENYYGIKLIEGDSEYVPDGVAVYEVTSEVPVKNSLDISVFPSPFNSSFILETGFSEIGSKYEIYDLTGRKVLGGKIENSEKTTIDAMTLAAGIYLLRVHSHGGYQDVKIVSLK